MTQQSLCMYNEMLKGHKRDFLQCVKFPDIMTIVDTIDLLLNSDISICRLGDGELAFASEKNTCIYESGDDSLRESMRRILRESNDRCLVCLNRAHFYTNGFTHGVIDNFSNWAFGANMVREFGGLDIFGLERYGASEFSCARHHYNLPYEFWRDYFRDVKKLFDGKRIAFVTGNYNNLREGCIFRDAQAIEIVATPYRNAWGAREHIRNGIFDSLSRGCDLVVFACGPTATVLSWEFSKYVRCLDVGHLEEEYFGFLNGSDVLGDFGRFFNS